MASNRTPRKLISEYLDASKTQILSPYRRQQRRISRTPEAHGRSRSQILSHDRVSSLRGKRRSISSLDEEETPRQLISQFIASTDTATPLVRQGRRTSQSGVYQSQPAIPVSNKRRRRSSNFSDSTTNIESETPRTLINRYLQNTSQTVDTPVVRHEPSHDEDTPEHMLVQETYNTPSPFKESSQGSTSSMRMSARQQSRLSRSAHKNLTGNYSLVIPESQSILSSPVTDKILKQNEFEMPSIFGSSDGEDETPFPEISRYNKSRHHHGGYNLTVPESMLERTDYRDHSEYRNQNSFRDEYDDHDQITTGRDRYTDRGSTGRDRSIENRNRSAYQEEEDDLDRGENEDFEDREMEDRRARDRQRGYRESMNEDRERRDEDRERMNEDRERRDEAQYREYELPMAPVDSVHHEDNQDMYEDTIGGANQNYSVHDQLTRFSPRVSSTQRSRNEQEEELERMRGSMSGHRTSMHNVDYDAVGINSSRHSTVEDQYLHLHEGIQSPRGVRSHSFGVIEGTASNIRSPRRSAPTFITDDMDTSPIISGKLYQKNRNVTENIHSIADQFSPRISSTQKFIHMDDETRETTPPRLASPMETMTPSPVVSPDQPSPDYVESRKNTPTSANRRLYESARSPQSSRSQRGSLQKTPQSSRSQRGSPSRTPSSIRSRGSLPNTPQSSRSRRGSGESYRNRSVQMNNLTQINEQSAGVSQLNSGKTSDSSEGGSVSNLGIRITTPSSRRNSSIKTPQSTQGSVTKGTRTPSSKAQMSRTPESVFRTPQSRSRTPQSISRSMSRSRTPQSISQSLSRSRTQTPKSLNKQSSTRVSPQSPMVAGRMSRQPNRDMVHTLPNNTAFFSPQVASTQELTAGSRRAHHADDEDMEHGGPAQEMDDEDKMAGALPDVDENEEEEEPVDNVDKENVAAARENDKDWEDEEDVVDGLSKTAAEPAISKKVQRAPRKPREKNSYIIPVNLVKKRCSHYAGMRLDRDAVKAVMDISEKYWTNLAADLTAYAQHAGRKKINMADMALLFKRQGHVTERQSLTALIEKHLPMEERERLIPCARAFNKIELNRKYI